MLDKVTPSDFVIAPPPVPSVAVHGESKRFPVRRIFCVGRNYAAHAREMGKDPDREPPFFFTKPADAVVDNGVTIPYPPETKNVHYEIELVVAIGREGFEIPGREGARSYLGFMAWASTSRAATFRGQAKDMGRPWDWGKAFDRSAPCAPLHPVAKTGHLSKGRIWLAVNGETKQDGDLTELIWPVADIIAILSRSMEIQAGRLDYDRDAGRRRPRGAGRQNDRRRRRTR